MGTLQVGDRRNQPQIKNGEYDAVQWYRKQNREHNLPETIIAPENGWLEYYFPIGEVYFQRIC